MKGSVLKKIWVGSGVLAGLLLGWIAVSAAVRIQRIGVSIVGGADGPTAVFLTTTHPAFPWALGAVAVFLGAGMALLLRKIRKKG